jgi:hypothetical protein
VTTETEAVEGEGRFGGSEGFLGSDWDELCGQPHRKKPSVFECTGSSV